MERVLKNIKYIDYIAADNKFIATCHDGSQFEPSEQLLQECELASQAAVTKLMEWSAF
jgi:hypothetical protein